MPTQAVELPLSPATLLTRCADNPYVFLLDGGTRESWGTTAARFSFGPCAVLRVDSDGNSVVTEGRRQQRWSGDPFDLLERFRTSYGGRASGVVVALSYDLRCFVERLAPPRHLDPPVLLHAAAYDWLLTYTYDEARYVLESKSRASGELAEIARYLEARARQLKAPCRSRRVCLRPTWGERQYVSSVNRALEYIAAGDVYQVNLAQQFVGDGRVDASKLFAEMLRHNPVPYSAYVDVGDCQLVSNSPECFVRLRDSTVSTFPIKGTRRRGSDPTDDAAQSSALKRDVKERAEHIMIVDLERNDLGRICEIGSVRVEDLAKVHRFPNLHHLVSSVHGELRSDIQLPQVLRAMFPGGSITGAPKIRAMEIIDELEATSRGFYTGSIGFLSEDGDANFNVAIRTAVVTRDRVSYHAGGGIVADSNPEQERQETLLKAQPFFAAIASLAE